MNPMPTSSIQSSHFRRPKRDVNTERLENIGGPALGAGRPVAVLGDLHPCAGSDESRGGRDVEGAERVPAGADHVHEHPLMGALHRDGRPAHPVGQAGDLVGGLPFDAETHEEPGHLGIVQSTAHQLVEDGGRLLPGEVLPFGHPLESVAELKKRSRLRFGRRRAG